MPKIKNIIIFLIIGAIFVSIYIFYIKKSPESSGSLTSSKSLVTPNAPVVKDTDENVTKDFLTLLLNIKSIKLDDGIFSDEAFTSLHDSSITLTPDGNEGRPNPFAPLGTDVVPPVASITR